jgi:hypothetical protein
VRRIGFPLRPATVLRWKNLQRKHGPIRSSFSEVRQRIFPQSSAHVIFL